MSTKIAISGDLGSGKSTIGKLIEARNGFKFHSGGNIYRGLADKYNMTEQLDESYKNLLVTGYATLNDKITYYNKKNSIVAFSMKIIRKIKSIIARV